MLQLVEGMAPLRGDSCKFLHLISVAWFQHVKGHEHGRCTCHVHAGTVATAVCLSLAAIHWYISISRHNRTRVSHLTHICTWLVIMNHEPEWIMYETSYMYIRVHVHTNSLCFRCFQQTACPPHFFCIVSLPAVPMFRCFSHVQIESLVDCWNATWCNKT